MLRLPNEMKFMKPASLEIRYGLPTRCLDIACTLMANFGIVEDTSLVISALLELIAFCEQVFRCGAIPRHVPDIHKPKYSTFTMRGNK